MRVEPELEPSEWFGRREKASKWLGWTLNWASPGPLTWSATACHVTWVLYLTSLWPGLLLPVPPRWGQHYLPCKGFLEFWINEGHLQKAEKSFIKRKFENLQKKKKEKSVTSNQGEKSSPGQPGAGVRRESQVPAARDQRPERKERQAPDVRKRVQKQHFINIFKRPHDNLTIKGRKNRMCLMANGYRRLQDLLPTSSRPWRDLFSFPYAHIISINAKSDLIPPPLLLHGKALPKVFK